MALNRDKYRKIVGGITTSDQAEEPAATVPEPVVERSRPERSQPVGQGSGSAVRNDYPEDAAVEETPRFAKRGRPKGRKSAEPAAKVRKVKVSLFLSEVIINDLYDWAHEDKIHPGEMFERALKPFHENEAKRRKGGKPEKSNA
jgi:hypothetical protein